MLVTFLFAALLAAAACCLAALLMNGAALALRRLQNKETRPTTLRWAKKSLAWLVAFCLLSGGLVGITQLAAFTPAIPGEDSIAQLRQVTLNGRKEWISLRGQNKTKPVLLFLAGGPGGSQMAAVRHDLAALEQHFVVVNWDQPGSGKSYRAAGAGSITADTYIQDGLALTQYLCETFGQEKIYLVGESWGSALGVLLAQEAPQLYHAFIGTGQMVAFLETETTDYALALRLAGENGDEATLQTLRANGPPPYYGKDVTWKSAAYLQYLSGQMAANPAIQNGGYNTFRDLFSSEYGLLDKINYLRGIVTTFNQVYPQLYPVDLRADCPTLEVPVYFFLGRHDLNAPTGLAEEYFSALHAPAKELVWFEHSGHSPWINESERFMAELLRVTGVA